MRIEIKRTYEPNATYGYATLLGEGVSMQFKTLELPWLDNQRRISCIPEGVYQVMKHISPKFGKTFFLPDVPNRSEILIHKGNYTRDTLGCILPGSKFKDIDGDTLPDVIESGQTMNTLWRLLPNEFEIEIS